MDVAAVLNVVDLKLVSDVLMLAGTIGATAYCMVLARRLRSFSTLESGMGGAIAVLSVQVDDMTKALDKSIAIENIRLLAKSGGKSGDWRRNPDPGGKKRG